MNKDNNQAALSLAGTGVGKYRINVTTDALTVSTIVTVTDSLKFKSASY